LSYKRSAASRDVKHSEIIVSVSGVRGIAGESLTPQSIIKFTSAFAGYCSKKPGSKKIVTGRDGRLHGNVISEIVINTLLLSGFEVIDIGIAPTPTIQLATEHLKAAGGISVTASHNPQEWNGLKFLNPNGTFLDELQVKELITLAGSGKFNYSGIDGIKKVIRDGTWIEKHIDMVLKLPLIQPGIIKKRKFKIVVDAVNSSGSEIIPLLLERLGCGVIELYGDGSGKFPHDPEPLPENLKQLSKAVKNNKADLGIAIDPDADRMVLITDKGEPFIEENSIAAVINFILRSSKKKNKRVTVNLSTTRAVDDIAGEYGADVFRSPVGEINVVKEMMRNGSVIGGEGSGGIIYPELHYGRDSIAGTALVLQELAEFNGKISEYKDQLPLYHISKTKIKNVKEPDKLLKRINKNYSSMKDVKKITSNDGLKIDFESSWVHLRRSNTEPVIRIIAEAKTKKKALELQDKFKKEIEGKSSV
jgi:phosphomannomutase